MALQRDRALTIGPDREEKILAVRPPSLRSIAAFEAAARHQSFTRAAAELNLTTGAIVADIDVASARRAERWGEHERIEDVMDLPGFVEFRGRIWKLLREQDFQTIASEMA